MNSKRAKIREIIKWKPVLSEEYFLQEFRLESFIIGDIIDSKHTSSLIKDLQQVYPLSNKLQFKRIRNYSGNSLQVIISPKDIYTGLSKEILSRICNIRELELPNGRVLTRKQYELVSSKFWPIQFHPNKRIESLIDSSFEKYEEQLILRSDFYSHLAMDLAKFYQSSRAALIIDPKKDRIVGSGIDQRSKHPLQHSVIMALRNMAKGQLEVSDILQDNPIVDYLNSQDKSVDELVIKEFDKNDYLENCFNFEIMRYPALLKYLHERPLLRNPIWYPENPRHRLFLPNYWLKLVQHNKVLPNDVVKFECHWQMNSTDVKSYLEKLYNVSVIDVRIEIKRGEYAQHPKMANALSPPLEDRKFCYIQLKDSQFSYPEIFGEKDPKKEDLQKMIGIKNLRHKKKNDISERIDINGWF